MAHLGKHSCHQFLIHGVIFGHQDPAAAGSGPAIAQLCMQDAFPFQRARQLSIRLGDVLVALKALAAAAIEPRTIR